MEITKVFNNSPINWMTFFIKMAIYINTMGILVLLLKKEEITQERVLAFTAFSLLISVVNYLKHIKSIDIKNGLLVFNYNYKKNEDLINNYAAKEIVKHRGYIKYFRLSIHNNKLNKTFKIDSDEWNDYVKIKEAFMRCGLLED